MFDNTSAVKKMTAAAVTLGVVLATVPAASALASVRYGAKDCTWPTHAFVEATTTGWTTMTIKAGNGTITGAGFGNGSQFRRSYLNSSDEDAQWGEVGQYDQMQSGGMGCSI